MAYILILEDSEDLISLYQDVLGESHELSVVGSLSELKLFLDKNSRKIELMIADLKLPDGFFLNWISASHSDLMNTQTTIIASSSEDVAILSSCFEWGAVDYLVKPFGKNELLVKVSKALGNFNLSNKGFDRETLADLLEELTSIEAKIFQQLINKPEQFVQREQIMGQVWKKVTVNSKTLDVHLSNIRKKLSQTSWSINYEDLKGWKLSRN